LTGLPLLLLAGAGALLVAALIFVVVPAHLVRGIAVSASFALITFGGNDTAPAAVWQLRFVASIALLTLAVVRSRAVAAGGKRFAAVAAFWGYVAVGAVLAGSYSPNRMLLYFTLAVLAAFIVSSLAAAELRLLYATVIVVAAVQVGFGLVEMATHSAPVWGYRGGTRDNPFLGDLYARVQGTMGHPIPFAMLQAIAFIVAWSNPMRWKQGWRLVALGIATAGLVISGTRSAVLAVAAAIMVHLALNRSLTAWVRTVLTVVAGAVTLVNVDVGIVRIIEELIASGSWTHRLGALESVPNLLARPGLDAWFGSGFGSELLLYERGYMQQHYLRVVDNMLVYALGTMGIVGLVLFLTLWVVVFCLAGRTAKALLVMMFVLFFSFDVLVWMYAGIVLSMIMTLPAARQRVDGLVDPNRAQALQTA
jgi:hypothetical protein